MTRLFLLCVVALCASAGCSRELFPEQDPSRPQNLIVISVDTLRADHLGFDGYEAARTPVLDQLSREGVTFDYAIAPVPRTTPALASMFTGLWPHEHGARDVHERVRRGTFVAEVLREHGFHTAGVTANPAAGRRHGFDRGFADFEEVRLVHDARVLTDRAIAVVERAPSDEPLFLWAHYFDPHTPYRAPARWRREDQRECDALRRYSKGQWRSNFEGISENARPDCTAAYDAEVAFIDTEIGRLMRVLRQAGRLDNAIVVFTSDHGENLGEWGSYFGHGVNVHDAAIRVPLIVAGAGLPRGVRVAAPIGLHDLAPTLLSLADVPETAWPEHSGSDYANAIRPSDGQAPDAPLAFSQSGGVLLIGDHTAIVSGRPRTGYCVNKGAYSLCWKGAGTPRLHDRRTDPDREHDLAKDEPATYEALMEVRERWRPEDVREQSVSDGRFKLVERPRLEGGFARTLYDLQNDPNETQDAREKHPREYARLARALDMWTADIPGHERMALNPDEEAQLRALGYID